MDDIEPFFMGATSRAFAGRTAAPAAAAQLHGLGGHERHASLLLRRLLVSAGIVLAIVVSID
jgi:hypothetical protein